MSETGSGTQTEFYVAKGEEHLGPWSIDEIAERIGHSEIAMTDFVYDDVRADWIPLLECEALKERLRRSKPKAPPPPAKARVEAQPAVIAPVAPVALAVAPVAPMPTAPQAAPARAVAAPVAPSVASSAVSPTMSKASLLSTALPQTQSSALKKVDEWFVQKGANRYGPFTYLGLVHALQEKSVYDFDFVWQEGMETWVRLAEHPLFQPERIRELSKKSASGTTAAGETSGEVFLRRQYARIKFDSEVIVHDDRSVWMGQAFEASVGGSGLVIENSTLTPGQVVRLHFAPCDGLPAFNALGEIVGKRYTKEIRGAKSPVRYAVRFLKLDGSVEPTVREYFEQKAAG